jgi:hypothetical protein
VRQAAQLDKAKDRGTRVGQHQPCATLGAFLLSVLEDSQACGVAERQSFEVNFDIPAASNGASRGELVPGLRRGRHVQFTGELDAYRRRRNTKHGAETLVGCVRSSRLEGRKARLVAEDGCCVCHWNLRELCGSAQGSEAQVNWRRDNTAHHTSPHG